MHTNTTNTQIPAAANPADLELVGHGHRTDIVTTTPFYTLEAPTMHDHYKAPFHNFVKSGDKWTCPGKITYGTDNNIQQLFDDWGAPRVAVAYTNANDGTSTTNTAVITNKNNINYYDGRVRFLMANGIYEITGGTKIAEYSYGNDQTAVLVKVDIQAGTTSSPSTNTVTIAQVSSATNSLISGDNMVRVFPNPSTGTVTVNLVNIKDENVNIELTNANGAIISSVEVQNKSQYTMNLSQYGKGLYLINTKCNSNVFTNKVILE
jgi:hypothetical protein